jgi:hypothetical protein
VEENRLAAARTSLRGEEGTNTKNINWEVPRSVAEGITLFADKNASFAYNKTLFVPVVTDSDKNWEKAHRVSSCALRNEIL